MNFARNKRKWVVGCMVSILLLSTTIYMWKKSSTFERKIFDKKHETQLRKDYNIPSECRLESEGEIRGEDGYRYSEYFRWSCKSSKKSFADRLKNYSPMLELRSTLIRLTNTVTIGSPTSLQI